MVDHYPEEQMPEPDSPDKPVEYDTQSDPEKCKVRVSMLFWFVLGFLKLYLILGGTRSIFKRWQIKFLKWQAISQ